MERNQQTMCSDGFVREIFTHCSNVLLDESHPLHGSIQYMFELMAAQSLTANDLRYVGAVLNFVFVYISLCCVL